MATGVEETIDPLAPEAYSRKDRIRAINRSALLGWALTIIVMFAERGDMSVIERIGAFIGGSIMFVFVGLPIAFMSTWFFAGPILWRIMRRPVSWKAAGFWGGMIGAVMAAAGLAFSRYLGWRAFQDPSFSFRSGGGDYVREIDGVLTAYGWQMELLGSLQFVLMGIAIGLTVRAIIGPAQKAALD